MIKTLTPSTDVPSQENLLQKHKERVDSFHNPINWSKFVVMQDSWKQLKSDSTSWRNIPTSSHNLQSQWHIVSTLCHEMKNQLTRKVGFEGTPKLDPYWKSQPVTSKEKHGVEIRIESVNPDNSHSWVRISQGLNNLVTDLIDREYDDDEQETATTKTEVFAFASRSKAKAKSRRLSTACSSSRTIPILERTRIDNEPGAQFDQAFPVAKRINTLLRHGELPQEEDGAIELWRLKDDFQNKFEYSQYWSDDVWKSKMAGGGGNIERFQYCTDSSGQAILYLRALQGHSGRNNIDSSLQDSVLIPNNFFAYISHVGCTVNLHAITNSGLIPGRQESSKDRQTVFFTAVNPMHKNHQDPTEHKVCLKRSPLVLPFSFRP